MALLPAAFDSGQHDDMQGSFNAIPANECDGVDFLAHITGSEIKVTRKKDGQYISFEYTILDGKYKGRKIWTNLNIVNPNPIAVEIAQKELATLCRACGKGVVQDTQELHAIPFTLHLKYVGAKGDYPAKNEPCGYKPAGSGVQAPIEPNNAENVSQDKVADNQPEDSPSGIPWETPSD